MGIPSYFYQIVRNHGDRFLGSKNKVLRLFLDLNCCIHGCKNRVLKRVQSLQEHNATGKLPHDFEDQIILEVIHTIIRFCKETTPTELLWIAVDGVVPLAKMKQQRERRLNAIHLKKIIQDIQEVHGKQPDLQWDSNAITPGTPFMLKLCDMVRDKIPYIKAETGIKNIKMNGVRNPGEGEQKIFEYMRKHPNNDTQYEDVVYGLDADLIILSLMQSVVQSGSISLLREKQDFGRLIQNEDGEDELIRFNVSDFASVIPLEWGGPRDSTPEQRLKDYIILMSLMGNDFVPHTPSLTFRSEGVERILDAYKGVAKRVVNDENDIQWGVLEGIFQRLSEQEIACLKHDETITLKIRGRILAGQIPFKHARSSDPVEEEIMSLDWKHLSRDNTIQAGEKGWQDRYYKKAIGTRGVWSSKKRMVQTMAKEYLKSIQWCWDYYCGISIRGDWYYQYVTGPLLCDLCHIKDPVDLTPTPSLSPDTMSKKYLRMEDIDAQAQLICVLPPPSHSCIQDRERIIAKECVDLYPSECDHWEYGKRHAWEREAFLPRIPIKRISQLL
jgi:5'-3' exonuclease